MGPHPFFFIAIVILPYVLLAAALLRAIRWAYISEKAARPLFLYPLVGAFIITTAFVAWGQHDIFSSRSSTAAIGLIFLPFYSVIVALIGFLISGAVVYIFRFAIERVGCISHRLTSIVPLIGSVLILSLAAFTLQTHISRHRLLVSSKNEMPSKSVLDQAIVAHDLDVLAAVAKNPNTSATDSLRIYAACNVQIGAAYQKDYVVLYALAKNPKTPPDVLATLLNCNESSIRVEIARNPSTPGEIVPTLVNDKEAMVRTWVTIHPAISKELLLKLAADNDKTVQGYAQSALRRTGPAEKPVNAEQPENEAIQKMMDLGHRAASGDMKAVDEIEEQRRQIYEDVDLKNNRAKAIANLKLMRAAFDILGREAAKNGEAMKALEYANGKQSLRSFTVDAFGLAAAAGNQQALDALLNYKSNGWLLSSTIAAMKYPADENQSQAIEFLLAVLDNPQDRPLHHMARQGLECAAANGNEKAKAARAEHPKE